MFREIFATIRAPLFFPPNFRITDSETIQYRIHLVFLKVILSQSKMRKCAKCFPNAFQYSAIGFRFIPVYMRISGLKGLKRLKRTIIVYKGQISWINGMTSSRFDIGLVSWLGFYRVDKFLFSMEYEWNERWIKTASVSLNVLRESMRFHRIPGNRGSVNGLVAFN